METYYTKKEFNDLKNSYERKLKAEQKKTLALQKKLDEANDHIITLEDEITELKNSTVILANTEDNSESNHVTED